VPSYPPAANSVLDAKVAYFSMEIHIEDDIPTYSGGLGVLAGDTIRAAADLGIPLVGVTLVHRLGYVRQRLDPERGQTEEPQPWSPETRLIELDVRTHVEVRGRSVELRGFRYDVRGAKGGSVSVLFLDADLPSNNPADRQLTDRLYGGDAEYRLAQEIVLGIGGVRFLRALGCTSLERFHMNEGHAALLSLELLDEHVDRRGASAADATDVEGVRRQCVFTTHTPVAAGHDQFPLDLALEVVGRTELGRMPAGFTHEGMLNMTYLALHLSHYVNGVAKRHGEVSRHLLGEYRIEAITNGVHVATWAAPPFLALYDRFLGGWRADNFSLRYALQIPLEEIAAAHHAAKSALLERVALVTGIKLDPAVFTLGFGRRVTAYKRPALLLSDLERLRQIATNVGRLQIVYGGKAHPRDEEGKRLIAEITRRAAELGDAVRIVYLEDYGASIARTMVSGVDLWVNTPRPPLEASGTSGMKAAINGVPSLSVLDGWWLEGHVEGTTGWAIGRDGYESGDGADDRRDADDLYGELERVIVPLFYRRPDDYLTVMRNTIALTGSFFNTHRMLEQYIAHAYL
jgi:starch phosphorylase